MTPRLRVPVLKPKLPDAEALMPYLRRMDAARTYTNHGDLATEFEHRLAAQIGAAGARFTAASSGTIAIVGAILASAGRARAERPIAIIPGLTFVATAIAASQCGYEPYFVDVDSDSWLMQAEALAGCDVLPRTGVVLPVAAFGRPVEQREWQRFSQATGIPVVIDAAACFEKLEADPGSFVGPIPVALSLHATKSFAIGEGGGILTTDDSLTARVEQALNFGFYGNRSSETASVNGKLSELHACVGLAELDGWSEKRAALDRVASLYRVSARECGLGADLVVWPAISRCYALVHTPSPEATEAVAVALGRDGIETRSWYGDGVHRQPFFAACERDDLPVSESLASRLLALPVAPDLEVGIVRSIVATVATALRGLS